MLTPTRIRALRTRSELRQEDLSFLLGVGIATVNRWERPGASLPTGLPRQLLEVLDALDRAGRDLSGLGGRLRAQGNLATVRWLLDQHAMLQEH